MSLKEVLLQSVVVHVVKGVGGAAHKMSSRFLIGMPDLLIKLPDRPAMLVEVKLNRYKVQIPDGVAPDVTMLQYQFMKKFYDAGMSCGVLSFVELGSKGLRGLYGAGVSLVSYAGPGDMFGPNDYWDLTRSDERTKVLVTMLEKMAGHD